VSRCFGDIEAKVFELGGNSKVLIATPDIISFKIIEASDFIVFGSNFLLILGDGIFDKLSNTEVLNCIWSCTNEEIFTEDINQLSGRCVDSILKNALVNSTMDNVTCIFISFENFKRTLYEKKFTESTEKFEQLRLRVSSLDNYSFKFKEDENITFFHIHDAKNKIEDVRIDSKIDDNEKKKEILDESIEKNNPSLLQMTKKPINNKITKKLGFTQSNFSKFNINVVNFADCLKRNKRISEGHMKKRSPDEPLYPYVDKSVNLSNYDNDKRKINDMSVINSKKLNNSLNKPQTSKGLKNSFHFLNK
jgi:hypothetical protein